MTTPTAAELEAIAVEVCGEAADLVRSVVGRGTVLRTKSSDTDVVTTTDLRSEQLIRRELERRVPGSSVLGEEYPPSDGTGDVSWVVDPIDGTVNFLYDLPVIAVSIAARVDGETVAGAVADVLRDEVFSAAHRGGARRDLHPIEPSDVDDLGSALIATGYSYDSATRAAQAATVARLLPLARDVRSMGSAALQMCWVACGRLDAYYERDLKPWDHAAGELVARESGARALVPTGPADDLTIAASPGIYSALLALVSK